MNNPAQIDPEQVRRFTQALNQFATIVANHDQAVAARLVRLGNSFRDDDYERFRTRFMQSRKLLQAFVTEARKHVPILKADADDIQAGQRIKLDRP